MSQAVKGQFGGKLGGWGKTPAVFDSGRSAQPGEIADLILFLTSDRAKFISGSTISIDRAQSA